jgi:hypothetical protein
MSTINTIIPVSIVLYEFDFSLDLNLGFDREGLRQM